MLSSSLGELDGILSHGFDSAFKQILDKNTWNLPLLNGKRNNKGAIEVATKPNIILRHKYSDIGYELHCFPVVNGERINRSLIDTQNSPFLAWHPETMAMLFRINSLVAFSIFTYQSGDEADLALIKFAFYRVEQLIEILSESFHIIKVEGYNIAEFYQEIDHRNGSIVTSEFNQDSEKN